LLDLNPPDLHPFDSSLFGCSEIPLEIEILVQKIWKLCDSIEEVYDSIAQDIIKKIVVLAMSKIRLKFFDHILFNGDKALIETYILVLD